MERPRGVGAALRLGVEVFVVREGRAIMPRLGAEALIVSEWRAIVPRLGAGLFYYGRKATDRFPFGPLGYL